MATDGRRRGRLKVFLGAAAGVGKTFAMLGEARDLKAAGVDVVVGYLEPHGRRATEDRAAGLEVAPRRMARVQGRPFAEMDTDWLLERLPQLCLVDELAHTNHPAAATPSAGRTSRSCWTPGSTSSPRSTSSTWRASTTRSWSSPGCGSARPSRTGSWTRPTRRC
jgi:hypothetical protein